MKKIGIIGGAGPLASALLYESLVYESYLQKQPIPEIFLLNFPFTRGLTLDEGQNNKKLIFEELSYCIEILIQNGVEIGMLACNTMHLFLRTFPPIPILFQQLPNLVMNEARKRDLRRLLILSTQNTCHFNLYQHEELITVYPSTQTQVLIGEIIDRILEGKITKEDSNLLGKLIHETSTMTDFDGVVLGCTDLPVLHHHFPIVSDKPILDSIKISAKALTLLC
jgi:aspartate/glutamate racemase